MECEYRIVDLKDFDSYFISLDIPACSRKYCRVNTINHKSGGLMIGSPANPVLDIINSLRIECHGNGWIALLSSDDGEERYLSVDRYSNNFIRASAAKVGKNELFRFCTYSENANQGDFNIVTLDGLFITMEKIVDEFGDDAYLGRAVQLREKSRLFHIHALLSSEYRRDTINAMMGE